MKGHVKTPPSVAEQMVEYLFHENQPNQTDRILYPGCGEDAPFISAVHHYCRSHDLSPPKGTAYETHPERIERAESKHNDKQVDFCHADYLKTDLDQEVFQYIIGNPPYVPIEEINQKSSYRNQFETAKHRFDLYLLFFEKGLQDLADDGRLVFVTPEKFEYTETAAPLRNIFTKYHVKRLEHRPEDQFSNYVTYPTITVVDGKGTGVTHVINRDGAEDHVNLPTDGSSWAPVIRNATELLPESNVTLEDITDRISPGIATGRDNVFVQSKDDVPEQLINEGWTYPTIGGQQLKLNDGIQGNDVIICPYDDRGNLYSKQDLGTYLEWAELHQDELESRSCVENGKEWYSWHENPPMSDILGRPKLLCQDVTETPQFWIDERGELLPRHSVYYILPANDIDIYELRNYLETSEVKEWLKAHSQRASGGYYRLQSSLLNDLPVPEKFANTVQTEIA